MKRFLAALVAFTLLLAIPASADHLQAPYERIVRWAGCNADLVTSDERQIVESHYRIDAKVLYIGTASTPGLDQELAEMVLFHEIGHCLQDQSGLLNSWIPRIYLELDADRWAADLACARGQDGKRLLHDLFVWAQKTYSYEGDYDHGTLAQRIAQGDNAGMCRLIPLQAPLIDS